MRKFVILTTTIALIGCSEKPIVTGPPPVVTVSDTLCVATTRYHATPAQKEAFRKDRVLWDSLTLWLASFNEVRDSRC